MKTRKVISVLLAAVVPVMILIALIAALSDAPLLPPDCPAGVAIRTGDTVTYISPQCTGGFL